ncbi:MAG: dmsA [Ramlibacter sp.]|nr:dmsA [Ramlibacter sp.]
MPLPGRPGRYHPGMPATFAPAGAAGGLQLVRSACPHDCPDTCALLTAVQDGVALKVQGNPAHPQTAGVLCDKVARDVERHADYLLPATTQLEHWDIHASYGHTEVLLNRPPIAPRQARTNTQVFRGLAARMGFDDPCFAEDDESLCRLAFGDQVDFDALLEHGFAGLPVPDAPFAAGGFPTESGRCEFFSARLARQGPDGVPDHLPNHEAIGSSALYPLAMISPPARNFLNSTCVNVRSLRAEGEPVLELHALDPAARGVVDGAVVRVFNDRGEYFCKARVNARARPVNGLGIWWRKPGLAGTNVNQLTSQRLTDLGRAPVFYDCLVDVQPA